MAGKRNIRALRSRCKQILLIEGQPDCLFMEKEDIYYWIKVGARKYILGKIGKIIADHLKSKGAEIIEMPKKSKRACGIPGFAGLIIRKSGSNTTI